MNGGALNLLPFEFFPHLNVKSTYLAELVRYSTHTTRPIVAVNGRCGNCDLRRVGQMYRQSCLDFRRCNQTGE